VQLYQHAVVALRAHASDALVAAEHTKTNHSFIIGDRSLEVGDLESNPADVGGFGQAIIPRFDAVRHDDSMKRPS
jgi:hypothetical protein